MADPISIELPRTLTSFSLGVNLRAKEGGNFLVPGQTKLFYRDFSNLAKSSPQG